MNYLIIYQTKVVRLPDGRVLHLSCQGFNDETDRRENQFVGQVFEEDAFVQYAESYRDGSTPIKKADYFDLKIGRRRATYYDYADHLLRMLKQAEDYDEFERKTIFWAEYIKGYEITETGSFMTPEEFHDYFYNEKRPFHYVIVIEYLDDIEEIVSALTEGKTIRFYIE